MDTRRPRSSLGYVPVFIDGIDIEVNEECVEGVKHCYRGVCRYQIAFDVCSESEVWVSG